MADSKTIQKPNSAKTLIDSFLVVVQPNINSIKKQLHVCLESFTKVVKLDAQKQTLVVSQQWDTLFLFKITYNNIELLLKSLLILNGKGSSNYCGQWLQSCFLAFFFDGAIQCFNPRHCHYLGKVN